MKVKLINLVNYPKFKSKLDGTYILQVSGKGLSTNDFTNTEKAKLASLAAVATTGNYDDLANKPQVLQGITFIPQLVDGVLSWSNDGGLSSPDPVNIREWVVFQ